jgi:ketosteroid isomerase-like protein
MITTTAISKTSDEAEIRKLIDDREKAVRARDVDGSIANIAPDIVWFDVVNPLHHIGSDALRKRAEQWFASFEGPIGYEIRNLSVTAGDDVAFSHGLNHVSATKLVVDNSICGGERPFASARLTISGRLRTNITPCPSKLRAAKPRWT